MEPSVEERMKEALKKDREAREEAAKRAADLVAQQRSGTAKMEEAREKYATAATKEEQQAYVKQYREGKVEHAEATIDLLPEPEVHSTTEEEFDLFESYGCSTRALHNLGFDAFPVDEGKKGRPHEETLTYIPKDKFQTEIYYPSKGQRFSTQNQLQTFIDQILDNEKAIGGFVGMSIVNDEGERYGHIIAVERKEDKDGKPYLNWYEEPTQVPHDKLRDYPKNKLRVYKKNEYPQQIGKTFLTNKHKVRPTDLENQSWFQDLYMGRRDARWTKLTEIMKIDKKKARTDRS